MHLHQSMDLIKTGKDLLDLIEQNDKKAFALFYSRNFSKLILEAEKHVRDAHVAEEIVQDIFFKIWEDKNLLVNIGSIRSYLYRSVVNASINHINRKNNIERHHQKIAETISPEDVDLIDEQNELIVLIHQEIERLPDKCRNVFKLSRLEGLKYKEIALQLGISEKTVENHMSNALKILRARVMGRTEVNNSSNRYKNLSFLSVFLC